MASLVGQTLGRYSIIEELGAGGMGVVYRAHDDRLERDLALKIIAPGELDESARKRFRKEALILSRLSHPAIQTIHDFDTVEGVDFLVSELVPGVTLDTRITGEPLPEKEIVSLGLQLAQGLAASHAAGVLHRDLKPANLRVTPDGRLKILDFGLATLSHETVMALSTTETLVEAPTGVAGTLPYMSPEQLLGEAIDERSDLYSAGAVLYEMATGQLPFPETIAIRLTNAILHGAPILPSAINRKLSPELERIILKCLEKDPELRYQSAKELAADLRRMQLGETRRLGSPPASSVRRARKAAAVAGVAALAAALVVAAALWWIFRTRPTSSGGAVAYEQITNFTDSAGVPALSPDGKILAFIRGPGEFGDSNNDGQVWVKMLPDGEPKRLTNHPQRKDTLAFSPDGSRLFYTAVEEKFRWNTWTVPVLGGDSRLYLPNATGLSWIDGHRIMFSEIHTGVHMGLVTANESRSNQRDIYWPPTEAGMIHRSALSPDRKWVLMVEMDGTDWLPCHLVPFDGSTTGQRVGPPAACTAVAWSPDGNWMYFTASAGGSFHVWRQAFPDGKPEQLTFGPTEEEGIVAAPDGKSLITAAGMRQSAIWVHHAQGDRQITSEGFSFLPTLSPDGARVFYLQRAGTSRAYVSGELWVCDLKTGERERVLPGLVLAHYALSPDGKKAVFAIAEGESGAGLWIADLEKRTPPRQLTSQGEYRAFFGPPGEIVYQTAEQPSRLMRIKLDGTGREQMSPDPLLHLVSLSPDAKWATVVVAEGTGPDSGTAIRAYPLRGGTPITLCNTCVVGFGPARTQAPSVSWSPDGRFLYVALRYFNIRVEKTAVFPLKTGTSFPSVNIAALRSEKDFVAAGARILDEASVFPGPEAAVYAFTLRPAQKNLFRIRLP
jgi:Tol biopolymer transport system component